MPHPAPTPLPPAFLSPHYFTSGLLGLGTRASPSPPTTALTGQGRRSELVGTRARLGSALATVRSFISLNTTLFAPSIWQGGAEQRALLLSLRSDLLYHKLIMRSGPSKQSRAVPSRNRKPTYRIYKLVESFQMCKGEKLFQKLLVVLVLFLL